MNTLCISIDGLHSGMIGAYGNGWIETPTLDRLAGRAALFDRYYTSSLRLREIFDTLWQGDGGLSLPRLLKKDGRETILLTDDADVFYHDTASDFDRREGLEPFSGSEPVETLDRTSIFRAFATAAELLRRRSSAFLWLHLQGFRGPWDFPMEYRERHRDEEDPAPYPCVTPPDEVDPAPLDPDDIQAVMEAYAGGISVLDESLAGLLDASWEEDERGDETTLLLFGIRGFSLGEHGRLGADDGLYSENIQLPLMLYRPDGLGATVRVGALVSTPDLTEYLVKGHDSGLARLVREEQDDLHDAIRVGDAVVTPEWFLKPGATGAPELFVKPDDRWDVNDVADRCPEVVERLV